MRFNPEIAQAGSVARQFRQKNGKKLFLPTIGHWSFMFTSVRMRTSMFESMKPFQMTCCGIAFLVIVAGCGTTPHYQGDGQIKNTSYWADASIFGHTTEYTIRLASFDMSTNFQKEFILGKLSSFREPTLTICIRFKAQHIWEHFNQLNSRELNMATDDNRRNIDSLNASFGYRLSNQSGILLDQAPKLLKNYHWSRGEFDSNVGRETEIDHTTIRIPTGSKLKFQVSYTGDPSLTNRADFVILWRWQ